MTGLSNNDVLGFLGDRFFSANQVTSVWNKVIRERRADHKISPLITPTNLTACYYSETVSEVAKKPTWYLFYIPPLSLRETRVILAGKQQPRHLYGNNWWYLPEEKNLWTNGKEEGSYYLIRMESLLDSKTWDEQKKEIRQEEKICRAPSRVIIIARITNFLIKKAYILPERVHWGPEVVSSNGKIACASSVSEKGFALYGWHTGQANQNLGVFVMRKFDF